MKHSIYLGLAVSALLATHVAGAENVVYENDFSSRDLFNTMTCVNADNSSHSSQGFWNYNAYGAKNALIQVMYDYSSGLATPCDDYLVTPAIQLTAGHLYTIRYNSGGYEYTKRLDYSLKSMLSPADAPEPSTGDDFGVYQTLIDSPSMEYGVTETNFAEPEHIFTTDFVPETSGAYRLAFHAYNGGVAVDNIKVIDCGNDNTPLAVTGFTVVPGADAAMTATLSCTLPDMSATGVELTGTLSVRITRTIADDVREYVVEGLAPGASFTWEDTDEPAGNVVYTLQVVNGDEASESVSATVYVGPDTPRPVTGLSLTRADGVNTVSWVAPVSGLNGSTNLSLTYEVARIVNGEATVVAVALEETEFSEAFESAELASVSYTVTSVNYGKVRGESVATQSLMLGSMSLPFEDSFANLTLDTDLWTIDSSSTAFKWSPATSCRSANSPYDGDGGFLYYNSYNASRNYWSRLITPPLNLASVGNPMLSFAFYHNSSSSYSDKVVVEVSMDNGEFVEIPGSEIMGYGTPVGWTVYEFSLAEYKNCESARVSIKAISGYGTDLAIDAVKIYGGIENDLALTGFDGPAAVVAGKEAIYTATICNNGGNPVDGSRYSVEFYAGDMVFATVEGVEVAPKETAGLTAPLMLSASHIGEEMAVSARILFDDDEVADNDESAAIIAVAKAFSGPTAMNVTGENVDDNLVLLWDTPENEVFEDATFVVDGEGLDITEDAYAEDQSLSYPVDMNGWTNLDIDKEENLSQFYPAVNPSKNARAFQYISYEFMKNNNVPDGFGDGYLMVFPPSDMYTAANDWLISPAIPGAGVHTLSLMVKPDGTSYGYMGIKFDVLYSTEEEFSMENPADSFVLLEGVDIHGQDGVEFDWTLMTFEVPADAKRVAINFNAMRTSYSRSSGYGYLKFDDITLACQSLGNPQYNVYFSDPVAEDEPMTMSMLPAANGLKKHNAEPIAENRYTVSDFEKGQTYHVTALYGGGESELSEGYKVDFKPTGIDSAAMSEEVCIAVAGRTISATKDGRAVSVNVYASNGMLVGAADAVTVGASGVYIVTAEDTTARVVVR